MDWIEMILESFALKVVVRLVLTVAVGVLIGSEREKHGRAAGMRTHVLVSLGACLTSLMSVYVSEVLGTGGDVMRISAQVISGIGFLGAGMIIIKNNDMITGLTTAAGVWTTSIIGIALGYGFYLGALLGAALYLISIIMFSKFEKRKKFTEMVYVEIDDLYKTNRIIADINELMGEKVTINIIPPKSGRQGHLGLNLVVYDMPQFDMQKICDIENVVFVNGE